VRTRNPTKIRSNVIAKDDGLQRTAKELAGFWKCTA
jgi:hypothetical protein